MKALLIILDSLKNLTSRSRLVFVSEAADWVIKWEGSYIIKNIKRHLPCHLTTSRFLLYNKIVHFGSVNKFITNDGFNKISRTNSIVLTWYHVVPGDPRVQYIPDLNEKVAFVHTANEIAKQDLIKHGLREDKIVVIPEGIDLNTFRVANGTKENAKQSLDLPTDKVIIGSFQKDGVGWGDGMEPKLIKGPDIFCDVVEKLAQNHDLHMLLTGPARGYVKHRLDKAKIPYTHHYLEHFPDIVQYYQALDFYLLTSRTEGGPKSILESWATGIPIVTTNTGMIPDIATHEKDALISAVNDVNNLVHQAERLIQDHDLGKKLIANGLKTIKNYDWDTITERYYEKIYDKTGN